MFSTKFFTLAAAASFAGLATAVPTPGWPGKHGNPANIAFGVQLCSGENGTGACRPFQFTPGACAFIPDDFNDQTSSFVVADPRAKCTLYRDYYCEVKLEDVEGPFGDPTMADKGIGKQLSSYVCTIDMSAKWGQCGGTGWSGPTACVSGSSCQVLNPYYSQCL